MKSQVFLLTAPQCPKCVAMKALARTAGLDYEELDSLSDQAIELAVEHGVDSVPALIVNKKVFQINRPGCNVAAIRDAFEHK